MTMKRNLLSVAIAAVVVFAATPAHASSHREAPAIIKSPLVDATDLYMFRSYEAGREGFVTLIANYIPFQDPYGGPNYYPLDEDASYIINIDNNGDALPDVAFEFTVEHTYKDFALEVGGEMVPIPIIQKGEIGPNAGDTENLNRIDTYSVRMTRGGNGNGPRNGEMLQAMVEGQGGEDGNTFVKPVDNIGNKTIPEYAAYAQQHIYNVDVPGCSGGGRVFVGQRKESFVISVGEIFDLVNLNPLGAPDALPNDLDGKNITTLALELPIACLTSGNEPVIGAWTVANINNTRGNGRGNARGLVRQVSRLGMPLVNEVVIGLPDKNRFNASMPVADGQFLTYVTNPTLPALLQILFPVTAPNAFPRTDLVSVFLTGVEGLNMPANVMPSEMLRLNTSIAPVGAAAQSPLGVLGGDTAGFPNGRRPGDDVVDIALRAVMGALLPADQAPDGQLPYTDQTYIDATMFDTAFPYLVTPLPGAPESADGDGDGG